MTDTGLFLWSWSPVLVLTLLAVGFKQSALSLSVYGALYSLFLAVWVFHTPIGVTVLAAVDGVFTTLPLLLVIFAGILLSQLLMATGSLTRILNWFMQGVTSSFLRNLRITIGVGNFMEGASVIAEPVAAPMLRAGGVLPVGSAALSIIGYAGMMTLELSGMIIAVHSLITGLSIQALAIPVAWLSIPATLMMAAGFRKGWRASLSMALFGAMGQIIAYSGYSDNFLNLDQTLHIPYLLSEGLKQYTGSFYPVFVPVLGWVGTFLTGYGVASLMLFGQLQIQAAGLLGVSPAWL